MYGFNENNTTIDIALFSLNAFLLIGTQLFKLSFKLNLKIKLSYSFNHLLLKYICWMLGLLSIKTQSTTLHISDVLLIF